MRLIKVPQLAEIKANKQPVIALPFVYFLEDHQGYVNSVHYRSDGCRLVTSSWDGCVREWWYSQNQDSSNPTATSGNESHWTSRSYDTAAVLGGSMDEMVLGRPRKVTIVTYCCGDTAVVCAINQTFELVFFPLFPIIHGNCIQAKGHTIPSR